MEAYGEGDSQAVASSFGETHGAAGARNACCAARVLRFCALPALRNCVSLLFRVPSCAPLPLTPHITINTNHPQPSC